MTAREKQTKKPDMAHIPVMCVDMRAMLSPSDGEVYLDATFGRGGYSAAILRAAACKVIAIDKDPKAVAHGQTMARQYKDRLSVVEGNFADMESLLQARGISQVDGITLDLGMSSSQVDSPDRGFSFRHRGPLDMRMSSHGVDAATLVNHLKEKDLRAVLAVFGQERHARRVAKAIVMARSKAPITHTDQLANLVRETLAPKQPHQRIHPATKTFQALRIAVNEELSQLADVLGVCERVLRDNGRLVVVSFHSLEDSIVKHFLINHSLRRPRANRHSSDFLSSRGEAPSFEILTKKALQPSEAEVRTNARARSARLRAARRTSAPCMRHAKPLLVPKAPTAASFVLTASGPRRSTGRSSGRSVARAVMESMAPQMVPQMVPAGVCYG